MRKWYRILRSETRGKFLKAKLLGLRKSDFKGTFSSLILDKCGSFSLALDGCLIGYK